LWATETRKLLILSTIAKSASIPLEAPLKDIFIMIVSAVSHVENAISEKLAVHGDNR